MDDRHGKPLMVEDGVAAGDFLQVFWLGTRQALHEKGRESISLTITDVSAFTFWVLIAIFERAVGFYGSLVNVNACHQPSVEAGKKAANAIIALQLKVVGFLKDHPNSSLDQIAAGVGSADIENVFRICEHLAANPDRKLVKAAGTTPFDATYRI
jgi:glucose-6-phosphate isomerase